MHPSAGSLVSPQFATRGSKLNGPNRKPKPVIEEENYWSSAIWVWSFVVPWHTLTLCPRAISHAEEGGVQNKFLATFSAHLHDCSRFAGRAVLLKVARWGAALPSDSIGVCQHAADQPADRHHLGHLQGPSIKLSNPCHAPCRGH